MQTVPSILWQSATAWKQWNRGYSKKACIGFHDNVSGLTFGGYSAGAEPLAFFVNKTLAVEAGNRGNNTGFFKKKELKYKVNFVYSCCTEA